MCNCGPYRVPPVLAILAASQHRSPHGSLTGVTKLSRSQLFFHLLQLLYHSLPSLPHSSEAEDKAVSPETAAYPPSLPTLPASQSPPSSRRVPLCDHPLICRDHSRGLQPAQHRLTGPSSPWWSTGSLKSVRHTPLSFKPPVAPITLRPKSE